MMKLQPLTLFFVLSLATGAPWLQAQGLYPLEDMEGYSTRPEGRFVTDPSQVNVGEQTTSNSVLWRQYQNIESGLAEAGCSTCGGSGCNRCGCNEELFHWIAGPGMNDSWCVGPRWGVEADVLMLSRKSADWGRVIDAVGTDPTFLENFDYSPGGRIFISGVNDQGWGVQVGYEGANDWTSSADFPAADPDGTRRFTYESRLNSIEINFFRNTPRVWRLFSGIRYVQLDEDFIDFTTVDKPLPLPVPAPADPPDTVEFIDSGESFLLQNKLLGVQIGGRRDGWQLGRSFSVETFANAGIYANLFDRKNIARTVTTTVSGDDSSTDDVDESSTGTSLEKTTVRRDFTDIAFLSEAGVAATYKFTSSFALRSGYQVMVIDGVGDGLDAFFADDFTRSTAFYHGWQFGLEYRR